MGQGVYFAVNSSYSHSYALIGGALEKKMFRARVLVGESTIGNSSMRLPPQKDANNEYDSTCDNGKTIFVCFHDCQMYPEYLISYN